MYAQSDVRVYRTPWFGGNPWEEDAPIEQYWEDSPLKHVAGVTTPTLFLVGELDGGAVGRREAARQGADIIADKAVLTGTVRTLDPETADHKITLCNRVGLAVDALKGRHQQRAAAQALGVADR